MPTNTQLSPEEVMGVAAMSGLFAAIAPWRFPLIRAAVDCRVWTHYFGRQDDLHISDIVKPGVPTILHTDDRDDAGPDQYRGLGTLRKYCGAAVILGVRPATEAEIIDVLRVAGDHRLIVAIEAGPTAGAWLRALRPHLPCAGITLGAGGERVIFSTAPAEMEIAQ